MPLVFFAFSRVLRLTRLARLTKLDRYFPSRPPPRDRLRRRQGFGRGLAGVWQGFGRGSAGVRVWVIERGNTGLCCCPMTHACD
eukprot:2543348-Pyramimonas_sp.AAC.1